MSRVMVAPVGAALDDTAAWSEVGHTAGVEVEPVDIVGEPFEGVTQMKLGAPVMLSFPAGPFEVFARDVVVHDPARPRWVEHRYEVPALPAAPWKRRGLTGKAYRIARRRHRRRVQAWERAGRPTVTHMTGFYAEVVDAVPSADGRFLSVQMRAVPGPFRGEKMLYSIMDEAASL